MFKWAVGKKHAQQNPAIGVSKINTESDGWHAWTPAEVDIYRKRHEIGTKARLALELMMNVGARISDAARIGRQHEAEGWLKFVAWKNRNKKSRKTIECPITPDLSGASCNANRRHDVSCQRSGTGVHDQRSRQQDARLVRCRRYSAMLITRSAESRCRHHGRERIDCTGALRVVWMVEVRDCGNLHPRSTKTKDGW
jgi:hypothetical protein